MKPKTISTLLKALALSEDKPLVYGFYSLRGGRALKNESSELPNTLFCTNIQCTCPPTNTMACSNPTCLA